MVQIFIAKSELEHVDEVECVAEGHLAGMTADIFR
jgi:uncharacterized membrane protein YoaT (DUF817 family)